MKSHIFAHRGSSFQAPENTMPAFELAYQHGAEGIETDVQLTKDKVPILFHDIRLQRLTKQKGYIKNLTYSEIASLDAGSFFSSKYSGTPIAALEDLLKWAQPKSIALNLELKNNKIEYKHLEEIVLEMLGHYRLLERTVLSSFNPTSISHLRHIAKDVQRALITSKHRQDYLSYCKEIGANALHLHYRLLRRKVVMQAKKEKIPLRIYTVNKKRHLLKCLHYRCDGIITDVPDRARHIQDIYKGIKL